MDIFPVLSGCRWYLREDNRLGFLSCFTCCGITILAAVVYLLGLCPVLLTCMGELQVFNAVFSVTYPPRLRRQYGSVQYLVLYQRLIDKAVSAVSDLVLLSAFCGFLSLSSSLSLSPTFPHL